MKSTKPTWDSEEIRSSARDFHAHASGSGIARSNSATANKDYEAGVPTKIAHERVELKDANTSETAAPTSGGHRGQTSPHTPTKENPVQKMA